MCRDRETTCVHPIVKKQLWELRDGSFPLHPNVFNKQRRENSVLTPPPPGRVFNPISLMAGGLGVKTHARGIGACPISVEAVQHLGGGGLPSFLPSSTNGWKLSLSCANTSLPFKVRGEEGKGIAHLSPLPPAPNLARMFTFTLLAASKAGTKTHSN